MQGRFFAGNWRPPADEIRFAAEHGFAAIQIRSDRAGSIEEDLQADLAATGAAFRAASVEPTLEMLLRFNQPITVIDALRQNLDAIDALGVRRVHIHPVPGAREVEVEPLERSFPEQFGEACALAERAGLILGVEHNAREHRLLVEPATCAALLDAVPALSFVWDLNHTQPDHVAAFAALKPRLSLVHASDTPLPATNHHLPVGQGSVDFTALRGVDVPVILEIGGQPASGGYGKDTDEALIASRAALETPLTAAAPGWARGRRTRP
jgi:L-ribulose-5-phosphate 3-epimerase